MKELADDQDSPSVDAKFGLGVRACPQVTKAKRDFWSQQWVGFWVAIWGFLNMHALGFGFRVDVGFWVWG